MQTGQNFCFDDRSCYFSASVIPLSCCFELNLSKLKIMVLFITFNRCMHFPAVLEMSTFLEHTN